MDQSSITEVKKDTKSQVDGNQLTNSRPKDDVAPRDLSKAPMKPNLIVMFLASAGSGNKMEEREFLALIKWFRPSRPSFRMGRREALDDGHRRRVMEIMLTARAFMTMTKRDRAGIRRQVGLACPMAKKGYQVSLKNNKDHSSGIQKSANIEWQHVQCAGFLEATKTRTI